MDTSPGVPIEELDLPVEQILNGSPLHRVQAPGSYVNARTALEMCVKSFVKSSRASAFSIFAAIETAPSCALGKSPFLIISRDL